MKKTWQRFVNRRGVCLWLAAVIFAFLLIWPPWLAHRNPIPYTAPASSFPLRHAPLWSRPTPPRLGFVTVDDQRLALEVLACEALIAALYLTWGRARNRD